MSSRVGRPPNEETWARFLTELDWWIAQHGDAAVPQAGTSLAAGEPYPLGRRVKAYRVQHRQGTLPASRARDLRQRAGWTWDGFAARGARAWDQNFETIRAYAAEHGGLDGLEATDAPSARWLREQRTAPLTDAQRRKLHRIPGALQNRKARFEEFLSTLQAWISAHPERDASALRFTTVHRSGRTDYPLGKRAAYWRDRHAAGRLSDTETAALAAVPGWRWEPARRRSGL